MNITTATRMWNSKSLAIIMVNCLNNIITITIQITIESNNHYSVMLMAIFILYVEYR